MGCDNTMAMSGKLCQAVAGWRLQAQW